MKTFPFLLLLACLLNTALSQPSGCGCWPFRRRVAVSQLADSAPDLPIDILLKIASHADPQEGHLLGNADKTLRAYREELKLKGPTVEPTDNRKIMESRPELKAFYQAILKKDINAVKVLYPHPQGYHLHGLEHIYGLELAARYNSPEAAWILLACGKLVKLTKAEEEEREKHRLAAERQQTETGLALLALISHEKYTSFRDQEFLRSFILNLPSWPHYRYYLHWGPSKDARLLGLQLAVQCGTNKSILMLLAFGTCDLDMDSEEIKKINDAAEGRLSQMDLKFLKKRRNNTRKYLLNDFRAVVLVPPSIFSNHNTAIVAMQLALMSGYTKMGVELLHKAGPKLKEKLIHAAATLVTNADKSDNLQQTWELIEKEVSEMEAKMRA